MSTSGSNGGEYFAGVVIPTTQTPKQQKQRTRSCQNTDTPGTLVKPKSQSLDPPNLSTKMSRKPGLTGEATSTPQLQFPSIPVHTEPTTLPVALTPRLKGNTQTGLSRTSDDGKPSGPNVRSARSHPSRSQPSHSEVSEPQEKTTSYAVAESNSSTSDEDVTDDSESYGKKATKARNIFKKRGVNSTCHYDKSQNNNPKMTCLTPDCNTVWCNVCISKHFSGPNHPPFVEGGQFLCPVCRNVCVCARCRRVRAGGAAYPPKTTFKSTSVSIVDGIEIPKKQKVIRATGSRPHFEAKLTRGLSRKAREESEEPFEIPPPYVPFTAITSTVTPTPESSDSNHEASSDEESEPEPAKQWDQHEELFFSFTLRHMEDEFFGSELDTVSNPCQVWDYYGLLLSNYTSDSKKKSPLKKQGVVWHEGPERKKRRVINHDWNHVFHQEKLHESPVIFKAKKYRAPPEPKEREPTPLALEEFINIDKESDKVSSPAPPSSPPSSPSLLSSPSRIRRRVHAWPGSMPSPEPESVKRLALAPLAKESASATLAPEPVDEDLELHLEESTVTLLLPVEEVSYLPSPASSTDLPDHDMGISGLEFQTTAALVLPSSSETVGAVPKRGPGRPRNCDKPEKQRKKLKMKKSDDYPSPPEQQIIRPKGRPRKHPITLSGVKINGVSLKPPRPS